MYSSALALLDGTSEAAEALRAIVPQVRGDGRITLLRVLSPYSVVIGDQVVHDEVGEARALAGARQYLKSVARRCDWQGEWVFQVETDLFADEAVAKAASDTEAEVIVLPPVVRGQGVTPRLPEPAAVREQATVPVRVLDSPTGGEWLPWSA